uniref:HTH CENPB-type domain-containing protein n=1 Tax=Musca domestica TaxID=7370 RepID=A0A1I8NKT1_MUSDO
MRGLSPSLFVSERKSYPPRRICFVLVRFRTFTFSHSRHWEHCYRRLGLNHLLFLLLASFVASVFSLEFSSTMSKTSSDIKLTRKKISLETKLKVLDLLATGRGTSEVGRHFGLHESTIRNIRIREKAIRKLASFSTESSVKSISYTRDIVESKMEKILAMCIEKMLQQGKPIKTSTIKQTAVDIYNRLKDQEPASNRSRSRGFKASNGWLYRFRRRHNIQVKPEAESDEDMVDSEYCEGNETIKEEPESDLNTQLIKGLHLAQKLGNYFEQNDPEKDRAVKFHRQLELLMAPYRELCKDLSSK